MCTEPFVKDLIAQLIYLVLCGIRLIPHGTRLTRVCIFRYTWASSCHGLISYGTRRPRVCGVPCVTASCVPAGRASRTHEGRVCRPPVSWGQACTAKAPPGTHLARVSCGRANSAQVCTGTQRRPHSWGPSLRRTCKLDADVYRQQTPPVLVRAELTDPLQTRGRSVPARCFPVLVGPEFATPLQTRHGCVPGARLHLHASGPTLRNRASSGGVCYAPGAAVAETPGCVTR